MHKIPNIVIYGEFAFQKEKKIEFPWNMRSRHQTIYKVELYVLVNYGLANRNIIRI